MTISGTKLLRACSKIFIAAWVLISKIYNYNNQINTENYSAGGELGFVHFVTPDFQLKSSLGYSSNLLVDAGYFEQYLLYNHSEDLKFSTSFKYLQQYSSDAQIELRPSRQEYSLGLLLFDIYKPSVKYIKLYRR